MFGLYSYDKKFLSPLLTNIKPSIVVAGSSNTDMVIKADHLPAAGETILGGTFFMNAGGKGANQAVAVARLGGSVIFIAKTGDDIFGKQAIASFKEEGIDASHIVTDASHPSGVALITVDKNGENCIVVASGANAVLSAEDIDKALQQIIKASIVLVQLEIPLQTVAHIVNIAHSNHVTTVLNPAPVCALPDQLLEKISIITPNKKEAEMLTGIAITSDDTVLQAAQYLHAKGIATVIITLGMQGAFVLHEGIGKKVKPPVVEAIDTTAAGDVFNGALVVALSEGFNMVEAVQFACNAAAISVTRLGAQASAPYRAEVNQ
jgi:ribokinase